MNKVRLGLVASSRKEQEQRLPLHPWHIAGIGADVRSQVFLEDGYGERFGVPDSQLAPYVAGFMPREKLFAECDTIMLFKPVLQDYLDLHPGQVLWGCPHFVQDQAATQAAIDQRLTVVAMEGMQHWSADGGFNMSVCPRMGELAGFCSVQHALTRLGKTGIYGRRLRAAVIGFGSAGRGAMAALNAQGIFDTAILTRRPPTAVTAAPSSAQMVHLVAGEDNGGALYAVAETGRKRRLPDFLAEYDIIVNCVRQDTEAPMIFLTDANVAALEPGSLIVDVSCDTEMGFSWARPTTFSEPTIQVGHNVKYYAVDHSPSYLWDSATWVLSEAMLPYLRTVMSGERAWAADVTVGRAVEIQDGVIQNPRILSFQRRSPDYPHAAG